MTASCEKPKSLILYLLKTKMRFCLAKTTFFKQFKCVFMFSFGEIPQYLLPSFSPKRPEKG
jgi:hypothetical protein